MSREIDKELAEKRGQEIFNFLFADKLSENAVDHVADRVTDATGLDVETVKAQEGEWLNSWAEQRIVELINNGIAGNEVVKIRQMILAVCRCIAEDEQNEAKPFDIHRLRKEFLIRTRSLQVEKIVLGYSP